MNNEKKISFEWLIHVLVWTAFFLLPATFVIGSGRDFKELFLHFWLQLIFLAVVFYFNYFLFLQFWFDRNKRIWYVLLNVLLVASCAFSRHYLIGHFSDSTQQPRGKEAPPWGLRFYIDFLIYLIPVAFSFAIKTGKRMLLMEALRQEAQHIKLASELQHLRYQLQPHFFFNALNNIYSSIDSNPIQAKAAIHSLGKLMRYFMHKSDERKVALQEEIDFLEKYIDLMKMRLGSNTTVQTHFQDVPSGLYVPPLIFISLVENAFKHGVSATQKSNIDFYMSFEGGLVHFTAFNTNYPKSSGDKSGSGIGLDNLKKRLQILYPEYHIFTTGVKDGIFEARLRIPPLDVKS